MQSNRHKTIFLFFLLVFTIALVGCDMMSSIKDYFSSKDTKPAQVAQKAGDSAAKMEEQILPSVPQPEPAKPAALQEPMEANMLARVGNWSITAEALQERILAEKAQNPEADVDVNSVDLKKAILDVLVRQQLLVMDAEARGVGNKKEIADALNEARRNLLVQEVVAGIIENVSVSEEEIKNAYDTIDSPYFYNPLEVRIREIVADSQVKATEMLLEIQKGSDFAEIAKQHSISDSAANGGDLGFLTEPPFPEMGDIILSLLQEEGNTISASFKGPKGFYIVKIEEKKGGEKRPLEELKDFIKGQLSIEKRDAVLLDYVAELEKKYKVEINESLLK